MSAIAEFLWNTVWLKAKHVAEVGGELRSVTCGISGNLGKKK